MFISDELQKETARGMNHCTSRKSSPRRRAGYLINDGSVWLEKLNILCFQLVCFTYALSVLGMMLWLFSFKAYYRAFS